MKKYYVDLHLCSEELRDKFLKIFDDHCYDTYTVANNPRVYEVLWKSEIPIEQLIPEMYIIRNINTYKNRK